MNFDIHMMFSTPPPVVQRPITRRFYFDRFLKKYIKLNLVFIDTVGKIAQQKITIHKMKLVVGCFTIVPGCCTTGGGVLKTHSRTLRNCSYIQTHGIKTSFIENISCKWT